MHVGEGGVQLRTDAGEVRETDPRLPCWWKEFEWSVRIAVLLTDPAKAATLTREETVALLIALAPVREALRVAANAPSRTPVGPEPTPAAEPPARMLTLAEVAERSGKSARWWREHWRTELPTATRKGRTWLVPEEEFEKWRRK
jgi:hypothetical protein